MGVCACTNETPENTTTPKEKFGKGNFDICIY